ncbi:family 16 glycosylhydrolase [Pedobacter sp. LMG 31464]|uniref:Family 16 glycosylhydrolase n=1 Tax=Pedobacter planticolens TaxID=2679964 RepID=A0A923DVT5_9SPHI|nr:glycoside hydrolase family 16 protein [Pedobacter planticolens]MBB2144857.1 family 16 glycosylhydrolase [Pedobacter planticolens]
MKNIISLKNSLKAVLFLSILSFSLLSCSKKGDTPAAPANKVPFANAGADQTITLPVNTVILTGSGTDADGTIASYLWTYISGPSTYTIATPAQAQTSINNLVQGTYLFELRVTDNQGATGRIVVTITVNPKAGTLIFEDNFNTTGGFDNTKWSYCSRSTPAWASYLTSSSDYASLDGSNLVLKMDNKVIAGDAVPYHSGGIETMGKFSFLYGKVEVRAKFTQGTGSWPAIWMMPVTSTYGGWPNSGEIDIMEHVNNENVIHQTVHNGAVTNASGVSSVTTASSYNTSDYNTYSIIWTETKIEFYVNDVLKSTYNKPANATSAQWPYDKPFYLILNQSGGLGWPGAINNSHLPFQMQVDWVKISQ